MLPTDQKLNLLSERFEEAKQKILNDKWLSFDKASKSFVRSISEVEGPLKSYNDILPFPIDILLILRSYCYILPLHSYTQSSSMPISDSQLELTWQLWAMDFINQMRNNVMLILQNINHYSQYEVEIWNIDKSESDQLSFNDMIVQWELSVENLSLSDFCNLNISASSVRDLLPSRYKEISNMYTISTINKLTNTTKNHSTSTDEFKVTVIAVALVCVYLHKEGFFKAGPLANQIKKEILINYSYSYQSVYNKYVWFRNDENRLKNLMIKDIKRAINLLPNYGLESPISLAKADLKIISEKIRSDNS